MDEELRRLYCYMLSKRHNRSYKIVEKIPSKTLITLTDVDGNSSKIRYMEIKLEKTSGVFSPSHEWVSLGEF